MLHNFRRSKLLENGNSSINFEVETKDKAHLTQKLTGLKFKMESLSVKRSFMGRNSISASKKGQRIIELSSVRITEVRIMEILLYLLIY